MRASRLLREPERQSRYEAECQSQFRQRRVPLAKHEV